MIGPAHSQSDNQTWRPEISTQQGLPVEFIGITRARGRAGQIRCLGTGSIFTIDDFTYGASATTGGTVHPSPTAARQR